MPTVCPAMPSIPTQLFLLMSDIANGKVYGLPDFQGRKSTLAKGIVDALRAVGIKVVLLDGDEMRAVLEQPRRIPKPW